MALPELANRLKSAEEELSQTKTAQAGQISELHDMVHRQEAVISNLRSNLAERTRAMEVLAADMKVIVARVPCSGRHC